MNQRLAALDFITGCLGVRGIPGRDAMVRSAVVAGRLDWSTVLDLANTQKVAPALWAALRSRELVGYLPTEVRERLFKTYLLNTLKNKSFREQAIRVVRQLNAIGVEPILLKGGATLFVKTFDDPGSRVMVDLDFLVPKTSAEECWNVLHALGYLPVPDKPFFINFCHHHHLRALFHPDRYGKVEIHKDVLPKSAIHILPTQLVWEQAEPVINQLGIKIRIPSTTHRVLHNLLHADLIDQVYSKGKISLRSLHELVMMQTVNRESIDWGTIQRLMEQGGQARVLRASLYLAHRYFGSPMPDRMRPTLGAVIHYVQSRLQIRWPWLDEFVDWLYWFSTPSIRERYHCDDHFWPVTKGRIRLATHMAGKFSKRVFCLMGYRIENLAKTNFLK